MKTGEKEIGRKLLGKMGKNKQEENMTGNGEKINRRKLWLGKYKKKIARENTTLEKGKL